MEKKDLIPPGLRYLAGNIKHKNNILGASKQDGAKWAQGLGLAKNKEILFFAGCGYQFGSQLESLMGLIRKIDKSAAGVERAMELAELQRKMGLDAGGVLLKIMGKGVEEGSVLIDAVKVLRKLGIDFGYLAEEEPCCGGILHFAGMRNEFIEHCRKVDAEFKSKGVKQIISIVPSCTYTLKRLMAEINGSADIQVKHFCEVVAERLASLKLRFPKEVKVTYHDPCQLGRYMGLVDEPRKILKAIENLELVETKWTRAEWATCCGGGGGFEAVFPEMSELLAVNRTQELLETGAQIIVTQCPGCIMQLQTGLKTLRAGKVEVLDLAQVVALSMEG